MQEPRARSLSSESFPRILPATNKSSRPTKVVRSESDLVTSTTAKIPTDRSPRVEHRSPRGAAPEKKRSIRVTKFEVQLTQLREDLKRAKNQLHSSVSQKRQAEQEAEEAKKQLLAMSAKLEDTQCQLMELSAAEDTEAGGLSEAPEGKDLNWQSELKAIRKQQSADSAALVSAMHEIQLLKQQLELVTKSEPANREQSDTAYCELKALRENLNEALCLTNHLKRQVKENENAEAGAQKMASNSEQQFEVSEGTAECICSELLSPMESVRATSSISKVLESRKRLFDKLGYKNETDQHSAGELIFLDHGVDFGEYPQEIGFFSLDSEVEQLYLALEATKINHQEEQICNLVHMHSLYELLENLIVDSGSTKAHYESDLKGKEIEIVKLKENLIEKVSELRSTLNKNEELNAQVEKNRIIRMKFELEVAELKTSLINKEIRLQRVAKENELLKLEMVQRELECQKNSEAALTEVELARVAEREALARLGFVTEEADKSSRRAAIITKQLDTANAAKLELETELRRLRVQSDQWRKAAETAAALLMTGNNARFVERTGSMDSECHSFAGKMNNSPYSDDLEDELPKKKNINVLRRIGGLWKKGSK